jgi:hypothetical protein
MDVDLHSFVDRWFPAFAKEGADEQAEYKGEQQQLLEP